MNTEIQITQMWTHLRIIRLMKPTFACKNSGLYSLIIRTMKEKSLYIKKIIPYVVNLKRVIV